jgi:hypothetical protein
MSRLIEFYRGTGTDNTGRTLARILDYDDDAMESSHDFIQWLFPLREASQFNRHAPLLSDADIATFRADADLRANLLRSLDRFLTFLGLERKTDRIEPGPGYDARSDVLNSPNHNWLRITRVLHCLRLLGLEDEGRRLFDCLERLQAAGKAEITRDTFRYWRGAVHPERVR